jgi:hypothetical protein
MKKILLFGAIALSSLSFGQNVPSYVPTNGLVGWWPFNGNANDESGNGNDLTNNNGVTFGVDRNGQISSSAVFNGVNQTLSKSNPVLFSGNSNRTISCWVSQKGVSSKSISLVNLNDGVISGSCYTSSSIETTGNLLAGYLFWGRCNDYHWPSSRIINNWYHLVLTVSNNQISFYVNDVLLSTKTLNYSLNTIVSNLILGGGLSNNTENGFWDGLIDDIAIYNRVLTQQEITDLYNAQTCTTPTATITPQSNTTFCQGGTVDLVASTGSGYTYEWYNNSSLINNAASSTYHATSSGNYTVKVIDGACYATSSATTVTVNQNPLVSFTLPSMLSNESGVYALNASPTGGIYNGSGVSGTSFDPSTSGLGTVAITYDYTDNNNCSASKTTSTVVYDTTGIVCTSYVSVSVTDTLIMDVSLAGVGAPNDVNRMKVYPNPSNDIVNIDNGNYALMNGYSVKIMNALGQEVFSSAINSQLLQVSVNQLGATGNYFINVFDNNQNLLESKVLVLQ